MTSCSRIKEKATVKLTSFQVMSFAHAAFDFDVHSKSLSHKV